MERTGSRGIRLQHILLSLVEHPKCLCNGILVLSVSCCLLLAVGTTFICGTRRTLLTGLIGTLLFRARGAKLYNPYFLPNQSGYTVFFTISSWVPYQVSTIKATLPNVRKVEKLPYIYTPEDIRQKASKYFPHAFPPPHPASIN